MNYYKRSGQMDLTDRVAIETGLCRGESFKRIAKRIGDILLLLPTKCWKTEHISLQLIMLERIVDM